MRNPTVTIVLLVLLGVVPVLAVLAMGAVTMDSAGWNRIFGRAFTVLLAPFGFAGLLMIIGAAIFNRTLRAGRIMATVGAGLVVGGTGFFGILWLERAGRCVERASLCNDLLMQGGGMFLYAVAHVALIIFIWRARGEVSSAI